MGFLNKIRSIFSKKRQEEAIESRFEAIESSIEAPIPSQPIPQSTETEIATIQKDSFQLGLAAGYIGKSIKEIEYSLSRIETQMVTRDWFSSQFNDQLQQIINILRSHEQNSEKRFELIANSLESMRQIAQSTPEPLKTGLIQQIRSIESQIPLSPKMEGLLLVVEEFKEISYEELANKLGITVSALRGLLSNTIRRTDKIQRFVKDGKGWVKYID